MENPKRMSRRHFLLGALGAGVAVLGGASYVVTHQPPIDFATLRCPADQRNRMRVLVAYSSQYGTTGGVAAAIGEALCGVGASVDVCRVTDVTDVTPYQAVVVGSPVISEAWMPEAVEFVATHQEPLRTRPVAYFLTSMSLALNDSADTRQQMATILAAVQAQVSTVVPIDQGLFAGALDYNRMSPLMRVMYRVFSEDVTSGDFRNWDAIRQWAQALAPRLLRPATVGLPRGIGRMN